MIYYFQSHVVLKIVEISSKPFIVQLIKLWMNKPHLTGTLTGRATLVELNCQKEILNVNPETCDCAHGFCVILESAIVLESKEATGCRASLKRPSEAADAEMISEAADAETSRSCSTTDCITVSVMCPRYRLRSK